MRSVRSGRRFILALTERRSRTSKTIAHAMSASTKRSSGGFWENSWDLLAEVRLLKRSPASRVSTLLLAGSTCVMAQEAVPPLLPPQLPASGPEQPELPRPLEAVNETDAPKTEPIEPDSEVPETPVRRFTPRLPEPRPLSVRPEATGAPAPKPERLAHQSDTTVPALEPPRVLESDRDAGPVFGNEDRTVPPLEGPSPISLEAVPEEGLNPYRNSVDPLPSRESRPEVDRVESSPVQPQTRRRGLFGLFAPRPQPLPRAPSVAEKDPNSRNDPAAEADLKRRVESQVRQVGGRHLRSLEVQVQDRAVMIYARADRFWNRRSLQRAIESLPVLAGHRATVFVD